MQKRHLSVATALLAITAVVVTSCSDRPLPLDVSGVRPSFETTTTTFTALERTTTLEVTQTTTVRITAKGGTISLPGAVLEIPGGAVTKPTDITITIPSGDIVTLDFGPHGLVFNKSVRLGVDLTGTTAEDNAEVQAKLKLLYTGTDGTVQEVLSGNVVGNTFYVWLEHFSGYTVATGEDECDPNTQTCP